MSKAHKVERLIAEKINNKPLLITEDSLIPILDYLENRKEAAISGDTSERYNQPIIAENVAMIPVSGSLSYEKTWLGAMCGMTSYQQLLEDVEEVLSYGIKTIVLDVDSGGGEAYSCFSTAEAIRNRVDAAGATLITYIDGMSASAAYALTAVSDEVIINPMAQAGSIGVLIRLMDQSEALKQAGLKPIFITSADSKVPFDTEGSFKKEFLEELQESVDELHTQFVNHVASYRNITPESVNSMNAKVFSAKKAVELGLVDKIMTQDEFAAYLVDLEEKKKPMPLGFFSRNTKAKANVEQPEAALAAHTQEELEMADKALLEEMQAKLNALQAQFDTDIAEAVAALDEKDAELNAALQELADAKEALAAIEAEKAQAAIDAKKAKLEAVVGTEMAGDLFPALSALDDAAFNKVVASYEAANKKFEQSPLAQEIGYEADGTASATQKESALAKRLKAKQAK
jgi:signal peptide peptidase SppA